MPLPTDPAALQYAQLGRLDNVFGDGTVAGFGNLQLPLAGQTLGPGTYQFQLPCAGNLQVEATLLPKLVAGACTARLFKAQPDGVHEALGPSGSQAVAFPTLTANTASVVGTGQILVGHQFCILEITVPAGGSITIARAYYASL